MTRTIFVNAGAGNVLTEVPEGEAALARVREIVDRHSGRIEELSECSVTFDLPCDVNCRGYLGPVGLSPILIDGAYPGYYRYRLDV